MCPSCPSPINQGLEVTDCSNTGCFDTAILTKMFEGPYKARWHLGERLGPKVKVQNQPLLSQPTVIIQMCIGASTLC